MECQEFRIKRLKIENFKSIKSLELDSFGSGLNAIVGINGAGKSTILRAIDILFSWFAARIKNQKGSGEAIQDNDIHHDAVYCILEVELANGISWKLFKQKTTSRKKITEKSRLAEMTEYINTILNDNTDHPESEYLPLYALYSVNRIVEETPERLRKDQALAPVDVYNKELDKAQNYRSFFRWFKEREDAENRLYRRDSMFFVADKQLQAVRDAISGVMPGYENLRVNDHPRGFVIDKGTEKFFFDTLSDGEKAYLALVADIARRMAMTHPNYDKPLECSAIILIDEIDLHLHPSWQRDVLPRMRKVFPHCQFIVTTHSPFVLTNVKNAEDDKLILMENGHPSLIVNNVFGREVNLILSDALQMDSLRNAETEEHLHAVSECLAKGDSGSVNYQQHYEWLKLHLQQSDNAFVQIEMQKRINQMRKG